MSGSSSSAAAATSVMAHPSPATKYEVFLSFRGVDTHYNIDRGNKISDELYTGIEESMIYVIIFSQNYASSAWCLKELVKIWECKEKYGRHVIPVFYKVEPATIKYQQGSYEKAFADHINQKRFDEEEIKSWKVALNNAAGLKGNSVDDTRPEIKVVDGIVEDIVKKLNRSFSSTDDQGMVGIDKHIAQMESLLQLETEGVRIIGI
ncbi:TMV resistance protein N-like [Lotus japonicus]|uniref:TMV resistance protein N-like n=1 Tax=Lotus japonicus TaxID=34305 RepID=UPI00258B0F95|nr:TMV resistance protein N-like [Lotus japonicus]